MSQSLKFGSFHLTDKEAAIESSGFDGGLSTGRETVEQFISHCKSVYKMDLCVGELWQYKINTYSPSEVRSCCVLAAEWQKFRLSMKGINTSQKLAYMTFWMHNAKRLGYSHRTVEVQVDNYINAIKRGGQLTIEGRVQR